MIWNLTRAIFILLILWTIYEMFKNGKKEMEILRNPKEYFKNGASLNEKIHIIQFKDIPTNTMGTATIDSDGFNLTTTHAHERIKFSKINGVSLQEINANSANNSFSVGKAVAGTALFGVVGGAIGGYSGKNTKIKTLTISYYDENDNLEYIVLSPLLTDKDSDTQIVTKNNSLDSFGSKLNEISRKMK